MAKKIIMDSDFLSDSFSSSWDDKDHRSATYTVDCNPGYVPYDYSFSYGGYQGSWRGDGIWRGNVKNIDAQKHAGTRGELWEGIKVTSISYSKDGGSWTSTSNPVVQFKCNKNGVKFKVQATYELWSQGMPHRDVPFMWFAGAGSTYYNSGKNRFTEATPHQPGKIWAGLNETTGINNGWNLMSVSWKQPGRKDNYGSWVYWNSHDVYSGTWVSDCCQKWKSGMPYKSPHDGWTGYASGQSPQGRRKCLWWKFQRTYSVTWTSKNIVEKPLPLNNPTGTLKIFNNFTTGVTGFDIENNNIAENKYDGRKGTAQIYYSHKEGHDGYFKLYACQYYDGAEHETLICNNWKISNNETKTINITFTEFPSLKRSYEIRYKLDLFTDDDEYNTSRKLNLYSGGWSDRCKSHFYNEVPPRPGRVWIDATSDRTKSVTVRWDSVVDPDWTEKGYVYYYVIIKRGSGSNPNKTSTLKVMKNTTSSEKAYDFSIAYSTKNNYLTIPTTGYAFGENISIVVIPVDGYLNNYYNAREIEITVDKDITTTLEVQQNLTTKDDAGVLSGEHGKVKISYNHKAGLSGHVYLCAMTNSLTGKDLEEGTYVGVVHDKEVKSGDSYWTTLDFNTFGIARSKYIKYFILAKDSNGLWSHLPYTQEDKRMYKIATGFHYFNDVPSDVAPFVSENTLTAFNDDVLEIAWPQAIDPDKNAVGYKIYIEEIGKVGNKNKEFFDSNKKIITRPYTSVVDMGYATVPTNLNPYKLDLKSYLGKEIRMFIETYDAYNSRNYKVGNYLGMDVDGIKPSVPQIEVEFNYLKDFYGVSKIDGDNGYVTVTHTHPRGRSATVVLHAILEYTSGTKKGQRRLFKNIAEWNITSGATSPRTKINFVKMFGEDCRSSIIRYYAVATTTYGECSEDAAWVPTTTLFDKWVGTHYFNAQPNAVTITFNDPASNLHKNAVIEWAAATDGDNATGVPSYTVVMLEENNVQKETTFTFGADRTRDTIKQYTKMWDTTNNRVEINLDGYEEGQKFKIWVVPHDDFVNSYYYTSNTIEITKATYGKPIIKHTMAQTHSEYGTLTITYTHEDATLVGNNYVSSDPDRSVAAGDFNGLISVYCFVEDKYSSNYVGIRKVPFTLGQTKSFEIPFDKVSPFTRGVNIKYFIEAYDVNPGIANHAFNVNSPALNYLTVDSHYYNDEPYDTVIQEGSMDRPEDKFVYGFNYTNLTWASPIEPDGDAIVYYAYIKTPASFHETEYTYNIVGRANSFKNITYNRKYRIREAFTEGESMSSQVHYWNPGSNAWVAIEENDFVGITIQYNGDHLGKIWPEKETYKVYLECRDHRAWENSYYGIAKEEFTCCRKRHEPPNLVKLEVIPNLSTDGNGEKGKIRVLYTHPEGNIDGTVSIYAYQDGRYKCKIHEGTYSNNVQQTVEICFTDVELDLFDDIDDASQLMRSKNITYFAEAHDTLVNMSSLDKYKNIPLTLIPLLEPTSDGKYNKHFINYNGEMLNFNDEGNHYVGPVQIGSHYFNEEPPSTNLEEFDSENLIAYKVADVTWEHVVDPDGHEVSYELYVKSSEETYNKESDIFYNDDNEFAVEEQEIVYDDNDGTMYTKSTDIHATGELTYSKKVVIPSSLANSASKHFTVAVDEYPENSLISMWLVSKDPYTNSYYRSGKIKTIDKGHKAYDIRNVYPKNGSTIYNTMPRILIYLGEDRQQQITYVGWKDKVYNNKDNKEYFSDVPNKKNVIVFKPPVPYTTLHNTKVSFYVYSFNQCSYSEKKYVSYTYKNFFEDFQNDKLIPLKADHINRFRNYCNMLRNAYGLDTTNFTRNITKNSVFENYDFNETKISLTQINDLLNNADPTPKFDYSNKLIININDLDLIEYEGDIGASSYNEFLEWARLVYLLENM